MDAQERRQAVLAKLNHMLTEAKRMQAPVAVRLVYDESADVLYLTFGEPRSAVATRLTDGAVLRFDPATLDPVGITITPFRSYYLPRHPACQALLDAYYKQIGRTAPKSPHLFVATMPTIPQCLAQSVSVLTALCLIVPRLVAPLASVAH